MWTYSRLSGQVTLGSTVAFRPKSLIHTGRRSNRGSGRIVASLLGSNPIFGLLPGHSPGNTVPLSAPEASADSRQSLP
jgi:hypothetical protein